MRTKAILGLVGVAVLAVLGWIGYRTLGPGRASAASNVQTVAVQRGDIVATVSAAGNISPHLQLNLNFPSAGTVKTVSVALGDRVKAGQVLAQLDTSDIDQQVQQAQIALEMSQTKLEQLQQGPQAADIAAAQAQVDQAQANYNKTAAGPTASSVQAARAAVASAQAAYNQAVQDAAAGNSNLAAAKDALDKAQVAVQQAQSAYDKIAWKPGSSASTQAVNLQNATIDLQQAQANYNALLATTGPDAQAKIQAAQAQVVQAEANLNNLTVSQNDLAASQAAVNQAQANLQKVQTPATPLDIKLQQEDVENSQAALNAAKLKLNEAQITAPFSGVVTAVNITEGQSVGSGGQTAAIQLADLDNLEIVVNMAEVDVTQVKLGQQANITLDALPNVPLKGTVTSISPAGVQTQGVVNYPVTISLQKPPATVKSGMTAEIGLVINQHNNVLYVPNRAVQTRGTQKFVTVLFEGQQIQTPVTTGLANDSSTEIVSGLQEGDEVVLNATTTTQTGRAPGVPGGGIFVGGGGGR